jgi:hypothetical protein
MRLYPATSLGLNLYTMTRRGVVPVYRKESRKGLHGGLFIEKFDEHGKATPIPLRNGSTLYDEQADKFIYNRWAWEGDGEMTVGPFNIARLRQMKL